MSICSTTNTIQSASSSTTSPLSEAESEDQIEQSNPVVKKRKDDIESIQRQENQGMKMCLENRTDEEGNKLCKSDDSITNIETNNSIVSNAPQNINLNDDNNSNNNDNHYSGAQKVDLTKWKEITGDVKVKPIDLVDSNKIIIKAPLARAATELVASSLTPAVNWNGHQNQVNCSKTRPLLINHTLSTNVDRQNNQQQQNLNSAQSETKTTATIQNASSHLIFSSLITTQAKSQTFVTSYAQSPRGHQATTTEASISSRTTTTSTCSVPSSIATTHSTITLETTIATADNVKQSHSPRRQQACPASKSSLSTGPAGNAAAVRLIDMGRKLLEATREGHTEHVRQLVVNSGAPFTSDWLGTTALHVAAQNGNKEIAEILLRGGVNRDARTKLERTALHLAAQYGSLEVVDLLLTHGADVNARDMLKMTPLHWAVERGHVSVVERLLIAGADVTIKSKFQLTPIDIARDSDYYEIVDLFKNLTNATKINENLDAFRNLESGSNESHDMLDFAYQLALADGQSTSRGGSILDIDEPCIDLVELEWNKLDFEPDLFPTNDRNDEPKVEVLMKVVEELQKENLQLRQKVEQLSTTNQ